MPELLDQGQKRLAYEISDEEDSNGDDPSDGLSPISIGSKRVRTASSSLALNNGNQRLQSQVQNGVSRNLNEFHKDVFQPGSLIKVKLKNFVTYTAAEFYLGPSLNMVIGPNGTGKSTLVCAICLGLGWGSELLGRAKELGQFVKHGALEAEIEIELAARPGEGRNPVVQRTIRKQDNKSYFLLNGKRATQNEITTMAKKFSIQIDNLCQFLPQDRVVKFAEMTDVDRLRETQRAAAPARMNRWHDELKALRAKEKGVETSQKDVKIHLERLENTQNSARADVERWNQRESLLKKAKCLKKVQPIIQIRLHKNIYNQAKANFNEAKREKAQIDNEVEPIRIAEAEIGSYRDKINGVVRLRQNRFDMIKREAIKHAADVEQKKSSVADCEKEIEGEANSKKQRERDIVRVRGVISHLERQREKAPVEYDASDYNARKTELRNQHSALSTNMTNVKSHFATVHSTARDLHERHKEIHRQKEQLSTQGGKRANMLAQACPDTAQAWKWLEENMKDLSLQGEVHGPPILQCSVEDAQYAQAVESQLRKGDVMAITCTNEADAKIIGDRLMGSKQHGGLGLQDIWLRSTAKPLSFYRPPVTAADRERFGFEGYIIDFIDGPDPVLAMLCDNAKLHKIAYASQAITEEQHSLVSNSAIQTWVSGKDIYKITTRREYNQSSTSVTQLRRASYFVEQPASTDTTRSLDEELEKMKREAAEYSALIAEDKESMKDIAKQQADINTQRDEVQAEQDRVKKAAAEWRAIPGKIAQKQSELDELIMQNAEVSNRIKMIKAKQREKSLELATLTLNYARVATQLRFFYESLVEAEIRLIEAKSETSALNRENKEILLKLQRKETEVKELEQRQQRMRQEYQRMVATVQDDISTLSEEERGIILEYKELQSLEALEQEVQAVDARLEMMAEGNPGAIKAYQSREEEINRTREKLEEQSKALEEIKEFITKIRQQWEPELDDLVARINDAFAHNFQQIGCAGEVAVYKDQEEFHNWSIQISVRFREGENLSILNAHRQSGGERAVSTVFYLMALQELAQSPFRVVDEINQGMDQRNERKVHERMVDIACQERTSQYFLVTPKLLSGLKFHPKMKVHIINSGEHIPDATSVKEGWDLKHIAKIALRTRKGVVGAA